MAQVTLSIGGRDYPVQCHDGEEAHIRRLAAIVDEKAREAGSGASLGEARQLLFAALMLADQIVEGAGPAPARDTSAEAARADRLAERIAELAAMLETLAP